MNRISSRRDRWVRGANVESSSDEDEVLSVQSESDLSDFSDDDSSAGFSSDDEVWSESYGPIDGLIGNHMEVDEMLGEGVLELLLENALANSGFHP